MRKLLAFYGISLVAIGVSELRVISAPLIVGGLWLVSMALFDRMEEEHDGHN